MIRRREFIQRGLAGLTSLGCGAVTPLAGMPAESLAAKLTGETSERKPGVWKRQERVFAYLAERRARYASITRSRNGRLLILFTQQTEEQESSGRGDLFLIRRTDDDDWWFYPVRVYEGKKGEPRANGTMTTLRSGKIIAPFAELNDEAATSEIRLVSSDDEGQVWSVSKPINVKPLVWAAPYGNLVELGGELLMPVYGALSEEGLDQTRLCVGLLRSTDGGETWGTWSAIAGPDPKGKVSYEFPAVTVVNDETLVAITTERMLKPHPELPVDVPQMLVRSYSADQGKTWTPPEEFAVGSWASLTRVDDDTTACSYASWAGWGSMFVMFSQDGFRSIRENIPVVELGWLPGYSPGKWGTSWARNPIPLPPVVPNLKGDWKAGYYGFSSGLALESNRLMLAMGIRQKGTAYTDPPYEVAIPIEKERVQTITVVRAPEGPDHPAGPSGVHGKPRGKWRLAERWPVEQWRQRVKQPPPDRLPSDDVEANPRSAVLRSGRWVHMEEVYTVPYKDAPGRIIGREKGYWVWKSVDGLYYRTVLKCTYSDDQGNTWRQAMVEQPVSLASATHVGGPLFEELDGTLVAPIYGYMNDDDMSVSLYVSALIRSRDGGKTWGDWSIIGYDREHRYSAYSETTILPLPNGIWVALMRAEHRSYVPWMAALISRAVSEDRGKTWSQPEICPMGGVYSGLVLPDGAIAAAAQNTLGWGVTISYDYGRTVKYALPATYAPTRAGIIDDKAFWLYDEKGHIVSIYRRD